MNFVVVVDEEKAEKLKEDGYSYIITNMSNKEVYAFKKTKELTKFINKNYSNKDYILINKINF